MAVIEGLDESPKWRSSILDSGGQGEAGPASRACGAAGGAMIQHARLAGRASLRTCWLPDLGRSIENLLLHKLRTLLTMLGMIFGVAAVLSMLSIGAGAQQQVMAFIEDLGVRNLIVEARETTDFQAFQKIRQQSPGLTFQDLRAIQASVPGIDLATPRKRFAPNAGRCRSRRGEMPVVYGVEPAYTVDGRTCGSRRAGSSRTTKSSRAAALCVLGEAARQASVRRGGSTGPLREGRRAMVPGHRHRGAAGSRAG